MYLDVGGFWIYIFSVKLNLPFRNYHKCNWCISHFTLRRAEDGKNWRRNIGLLWVFNWIELVNLILGTHIKHCLSSIDFRKTYLLLWFKREDWIFLMYQNIAVIFERSERKYSEVSSNGAKLLVIESHFLSKALCSAGNSLWALKKWCGNVAFVACKRDIEDFSALWLSREVRVYIELEMWL